MIDKNIIGYDLVKNVVSAVGYERCGYNKLFVVSKHGEKGDYLSRLVEVRELTEENERELEKKYGFEKYHIVNDDYIMWGGEIVTRRDGKDEIRFYWS